MDPLLEMAAGHGKLDLYQHNSAPVLQLHNYYYTTQPPSYYYTTTTTTRLSPRPTTLLPFPRAGALQKFEGAIVAITHNQSFANSLNATHILRVANGAAVLSANMGLCDADFDHRPVVVEEAESTPAVAAVSTPAPTSKKVRSHSPHSRDRATPSFLLPIPRPCTVFLFLLGCCSSVACCLSLDSAVYE